MNIGIISREYPPFFGGGIGAYADRYSWALARSGHRAVVLTVSDDGTERREERDGVSVVRLPFIKGNDWSGPHPNIATPEHVRVFRAGHPVSLFAKLAADALPRLIAEFALDVIEAPDTGALGWFAVDRARAGDPVFTRVPIITVVHSPSAWIAQWNRERHTSHQDATLLQTEREQAMHSDAVTCPSHALATWAEDRWSLDASSIHVVPYPLGPLQERAAANARASEFRPRTGPTHALFMGRLEPRKGVDTLLEGMAIALSGGADLHLDLVGEDMPHPEHAGVRFGAWCLDRFIPRHMRDRVRLLGRRSPDELAAIVDRADIAIVPSPMDNFPITCMEAMCAGRVVVAADAGGMGEMILDGASGILFRSGDADACAAALLRAAAMDPGERRRLGNGAAARMLELCGNQAVIPARIAHYALAIEELARRGRPRSAPIRRVLRTMRNALRL
jgi:glycosyltransferase involved in cell wall biosynthesis